MNRTMLSVILLLGAVPDWACTPPTHVPEKRELLVERCLGREEFAIRLYYDPLDSSLFVPPVVIKAVGEEDQRLGTMSMTSEYNTNLLYISKSEMESFVGVLVKRKLKWEEPYASFSLKYDRKNPQSWPPPNLLEVAANCESGTSRTEVQRESICETLRELNAVIRTDRASWYLQGYRLNWGCSVPQFEPGKYPRE